MDMARHGVSSQAWEERLKLNWTMAAIATGVRYEKDVGLEAPLHLAGWGPMVAIPLTRNSLRLICA